MASATLTILSFYKWFERQDGDLFRDLTLPEGMDKDVLVNNILMEAAPFEVAYADPEVMQDAIGFWSEASQDKWQRWADAWDYAAEFNPLENFDRTETEEISHSGTDTTGNTQTRNLAGTDYRTANLQEQATKNLEDKTTKDLTDLNTKNLSVLDTKNLTQLETKNLTDAETRNLTDEHQVSAFDSSTYSPKDKDLHTGTDTFTHTGTDTITNTGTDTVATTGTDTVTHTGTDTLKHTGTDTLATTGTDKHDTSDTGTIADQGATVYGHKINRNARFHGNIGVTSLAQLLTSYDAAAEDWDLYAVITQDFIKEFCVMVY